ACFVLVDAQPVGRWVSNGTTLSTSGPVSMGSTMSVTGASTLSGGVTSGSTVEIDQPGAILIMKSTTASTNEGLWYFQPLNPGFRGGAANDSLSGQNDWLSLTRSGATITQATVAVPLAGSSRVNSFTAQPGFLAYNGADDTGLSTGTVTVDLDT